MASCPCAQRSDIPLVTRRALIGGLFLMVCGPRVGRASAELPSEVAGIPLPHSSLTLQAVRLARENYPTFLFNHCMRTYLFGAVAMQHHRARYDADHAFVAASLHDLGLLKAFSSEQQPFEIDGADQAARLARDSGASAQDSEDIWHAVALHDARFALVEHQDGTAMLVALGAGSDVLGPDSDMIDARRSAEIVAAFPRLAFKKQFTKLLVDHCRRKPLSQRGTWLEGLCRDTSPSAWTTKLADAIAAAPFAE
jgi:hypothetical protein